LQSRISIREKHINKKQSNSSLKTTNQEMAWNKEILNNNHTEAQLTASLMRHHQQRVATSSNMEQTVLIIKILTQI